MIRFVACQRSRGIYSESDCLIIPGSARYGLIRRLHDRTTLRTIERPCQMVVHHPEFLARGHLCVECDLPEELVRGQEGVVVGHVRVTVQQGRSSMIVLLPRQRQRRAEGKIAIPSSGLNLLVNI